MIVVRAIRFAGIGLLNTAVGLSVIWLLVFLGTNPWIANAMGYAVGLTISYLLNRIWTFEAGAQPHCIGRYAAAVLAAYILNVLVLTLLYIGAGMNLYLAQMLACAAYTIVFFCLCQWFVFTTSQKLRTEP